MSHQISILVFEFSIIKCIPMNFIFHNDINEVSALKRICYINTLALLFSLFFIFLGTKGRAYLKRFELPIMHIFCNQRVEKMFKNC